MCSVHLHKHDVLTVSLTVLLHFPIISMTCTLSYQCSNRAGEIYASLPLTSKEMALTSKLYLKILPSSYYQRTTICTLCVMVFGWSFPLDVPCFKRPQMDCSITAFTDPKGGPQRNEIAALWVFLFSMWLSRKEKFSHFVTIQLP